MTGPGPDPEPGPDTALDAAGALTESFRAMTAQMKRLTRDQKRNRRVIAALVISFTLDLAITAGLAYNTVRQNDVQGTARASDIRQCQLANVARVQDIAIWNRLLNVQPPPKDPKALAEIADLERLVKVKDTPRDCAAAYNAK